MIKKRRALSEIVSAILIISIVVSGLGLYVTLSGQRILGETQSVKDALTFSKNQVSEFIQSINMFKNTTIPGKNTVDVYVFNSGLKDITVSEVFVNGSKNINAFFVEDLDGKNVTDVNNINKTIPMGKTVKIVLDFTDNNPPKDIETIVLRTDSNKLIQIINESR